MAAADEERQDAERQDKETQDAERQDAERQDAETQDVETMLMRCPVSSVLLSSFATQCETGHDVERFAMCFARYYAFVPSGDRSPYFRQMVALVMSIKFLGVDCESPVRGVLASAACRQAFGDDVVRRLATAECRALNGLARGFANPTSLSPRPTNPSHMNPANPTKTSRRGARPRRRPQRRARATSKSKKEAGQPLAERARATRAETCLPERFVQVMYTTSPKKWDKDKMVYSTS
jgi:hypothetical protein